jgi:hypothetical protein
VIQLCNDGQHLPDEVVAFNLFPAGSVDDKVGCVIGGIYRVVG